MTEAPMQQVKEAQAMLGEHTERGGALLLFGILSSEIQPKCEK